MFHMLSFADTLLEATQDPSLAARLATQPWLAIPSVDPLVMAHAAKTYARLVARGGALVKNVELQVQTASEWLQDDRNESRRYAAALVFRELAKTAPFSIADRVESILDYIWSALRDPKVNVREAAATALSGCLVIAGGRDQATRNECYAMVFEQAQRGFKMATGDAIHGSLLGYKELFTNGNMVSLPDLAVNTDVRLKDWFSRRSSCKKGTMKFANRFLATKIIERISSGEQ